MEMAFSDCTNVCETAADCSPAEILIGTFDIPFSGIGQARPNVNVNWRRLARLLAAFLAFFPSGAYAESVFSNVEPWVILRSNSSDCYARASSQDDTYVVMSIGDSISLAISTPNANVSPGEHYPIGFSSGGPALFPTLQLEAQAVALESTPRFLMLKLAGVEKDSVLASSWFTFQLGSQSHSMNIGDMRSVLRALELCKTKPVDPFSIRPTEAFVARANSLIQKMEQERVLFTTNDPDLESYRADARELTHKMILFVNDTKKTNLSQTETRLRNSLHYEFVRAVIHRNAVYSMRVRFDFDTQPLAQSIKQMFRDCDGIEKTHFSTDEISLACSKLKEASDHFMSDLRRKKDELETSEATFRQEQQADLAMF